VLVGAGTYTENINFNGMAITVKSEYGADTTIIDGSSPAHPDTGSVVLFISQEDTNSVLKGFTITNGTGTVDPIYGPLGGGILCLSSSSPTIDSNTLTGNTAVYGGGMSCEFNSSPLIVDNTFSANNAMGSGGGIELYVSSSPTIMGNIITGNSAASYGGGVQCYTDCSPLIIDNEITNNSSVGLGGGLRIGETSSPTIRNNLIQGNSTLNGGGILCDGGPYCSPDIVHNTITQNTATGTGGGITCEYNVTPTIDSCIISYNDGDEIYCHIGGNPVIHYSNIIDTLDYGVFNVDGNVTIDAKHNWWDDSSGPYHPTANPGGQGIDVSDYVDFNPWLISPGVEELNASVPVRLVLQVAPNPFRNFTNIRYTIHDPGYTIQKPKLRIFDVCGRLVKTFGLESVIENPGSTISWYGDDETGREVASGVYFVRLIAAESSTTSKVLLVR
jgi:parallel beta-helix repeat protein